MQREQPVAVDRAGVGHRVLGEGGQVDRLPLERLLLVEPGQEEEVLDERTHPRALLLDAPHRPIQLLGVLDPAPAIELRRTPGWR